MSIKELDLEVKKVLKEAKANHILWESISKYNGVSTYSKALFYVLDIKYYQNIFARMATMLNLETKIPFKEAILEGKEALALYCNKELAEGHTSLDYLACEGYAEIIRKRYLNNGAVISNE
jgi:hypothetical protein